MKHLFPFLIPLLLLSGCTSETTSPPTSSTPIPDEPTPRALAQYMAQPDTSYQYEVVHAQNGEGYTTHVIRMISQDWLTTAQVQDPRWWHWLTVVVPDSVQSNTGLLVIGGGSRNTDQPEDADANIIQIALATGSVVTSLHNVPNQPMTFVGDDYGPRVEDELIAYAWRQYMEGGAKDEDVIWLPRLPMTKAAVRAMDTITDVTTNLLGQAVDQFVVSGASKRGWTTWTTAIADERVVAIMPIVIDMLNVVPSFQHHWQVYGFWAPAVGDYDREGIMEWQHSVEYQRLLAEVEPYSFRDRLTIPKLLINATGDQFFLPDSWKFYWDDLVGESFLRYVPNADHSLGGTDVVETIAAFHQAVITETPRPNFTWKVMEGEIDLVTDVNQPPAAITLWYATNTETRRFSPGNHRRSLAGSTCYPRRRWTLPTLS